jgi:hypothetical protein
MVLPPVHRSDDRLVHLHLHHHHRSKESHHDSSRGDIRRAFVARAVLLVLREMAAHLALDETIDQQPHDVSMAKAAIHSGFSNHIGVMAAGFLIHRSPGSTVLFCS